MCIIWKYKHIPCLNHTLTHCGVCSGHSICQLPLKRVCFREDRSRLTLCPPQQCERLIWRSRRITRMLNKRPSDQGTFAWSPFTRLLALQEAQGLLQGILDLLQPATHFCRWRAVTAVCLHTREFNPSVLVAFLTNHTGWRKPLNSATEGAQKWVHDPTRDHLLQIRLCIFHTEDPNAGPGPVALAADCRLRTDRGSSTAPAGGAGVPRWSSSCCGDLRHRLKSRNNAAIDSSLCLNHLFMK